MAETGASNRMMIVEDDPATRRAFGAAFSRSGWVVRTAATVAEALDLLGRGPEPDGMILDLILPDGDGLDVLRRVRDAGLRARVAVCTGTSDPMLLMRARALKPDLLLIKPVAPDVLSNLCAARGRLS
jgi:DNA-binding response OmpR family regulator